MMQSATMWLGISGLLIIAFCTLLDIKGATMIGVLWVTFISWIPGTEVSYFGEDSQVPGALTCHGHLGKLAARNEQHDDKTKTES